MIKPSGAWKVISPVAAAALHVVDSGAAGLLDHRLPQIDTKVAGLSRVAGDTVVAISGLVGGDKGFVLWGVGGLIVVPSGVVTGNILRANAAHFFFGNANRHHRQCLGGEAGILELLEEGHVAVTIERVEDGVRLRLPESC